MSAVWDRSSATGSTLLVLLALADHANAEGLCWPAIAKVARMARVDRATVFRALNDLEKTGDLRRVQRFGGQPGQTNVYRVTPGAVENLGDGSHLATRTGRISQQRGRTLGTNEGSQDATQTVMNRKEPRAGFVSDIPEDFDPAIADRVSEVREALGGHRGGLRHPPSHNGTRPPVPDAIVEEAAASLAWSDLLQRPDIGAEYGPEPDDDGWTP